MRLQQVSAENFVFANGVYFSVHLFIQCSAEQLGISLKFEDQGVNEIATICGAIYGDKASGLTVDDLIVKIDPRYFQLT